MKRVTVETNFGDKFQTALPKNLVWDSSEIIETGITLKKVWVGRKWIITKEYSQWLLPDSSGCIKGSHYKAYDKKDSDNDIFFTKLKKIGVSL